MWPQKPPEAISDVLNSKKMSQISKFSWGSMPPDPSNLSMLPLPMIFPYTDKKSCIKTLTINFNNGNGAKSGESVTIFIVVLIGLEVLIN